MELKLLTQNKTPRLIYTSQAFAKILGFINTKHAQKYEFGFVASVSKENNDYYITDVFIHPQICRQAFYETDDDSYPEWFAKSFKTAEQRKTIRCQAHSHVFMSTNPSGVDNKQIMDLVDSVSDYYIQLIINLKLKNTVNLYSKTDNLIYYNIPEYVLVGKTEIKLDDELSIANFDNLQKLKIKPTISSDYKQLTFKDLFTLHLGDNPYYTISDNYLFVDLNANTISSLQKFNYDKVMTTYCKVEYLKNNNIIPSNLIYQDDYYKLKGVR